MHLNVFMSLGPSLKDEWKFSQERICLSKALSKHRELRM